MMVVVWCIDMLYVVIFVDAAGTQYITHSFTIREADILMRRFSRLNIWLPTAIMILVVGFVLSSQAWQVTATGESVVAPSDTTIVSNSTNFHSDSMAITVPTTSNPTINTAAGGIRIIANSSFESPRPTTMMTCENAMGGWFTTQPVISAYGCRVFEAWGQGIYSGDALSGVSPPDGVMFTELNAYVSSMTYQPICMIGGENFDFQFYHHTRYWSETNTIEFRFGIPPSLPSYSGNASKPGDSYSVRVIQGATSVGGSGSASAVVTSYLGTSGAGYQVLGSPKTNWVRYYGTHTIANTFGGVRNLGFYGIIPTGGTGNMLDAITIDLLPIMDMGASRDQTGLEGVAPTSLKVRINGKVTTGTKIAVRRKLADPGTATSDTDFTLGTPTAGIYGNASVAHTTGTDLWMITVPPGYYDGGMVPGNNQGGLTIPITYLTDSASEGTEWAWFELARPTKDGSSPYFSNDYSTVTGDWIFADPICDGSFKSDGVVYTITELADTPTPTATRTATSTRTSTPTRTFTNTRTNTPTNTNTFTPTDTATFTPSNTATATRTPSRTPTDTSTPSDTATPTDTNTPTNTPTNTFTRTITPSPGPFSQIKTAIGDLFVLGLLQNGTLVTWGINETGINQSAIPTALRTLLFKDIAASVANGYALTEDGDLYTWGENLYGEGTIPSIAQSNVLAIGAGARFAFAILSDHTVVAWGRNEWGQTNVPATATDVIAIDGGDRHAVALKSNGTVIAWGDNRLGQARVPAGLIGVASISAGENHTLALLDTGRVIGWGSNSRGQLSIPANVTDIVAIAAGRECSLAVKADGTLITWGDARYLNFPTDVRYLPIVAIDSDNQNSVVSTRNGQIFVAGTNLRGVMASRTSTSTPLITETPSLTRVPTESLTPSLTRSQTPTRSLTPSRTLSRTRTPSLSRTRTPSRTKFPTWTHTP